jgi:hypothetical protein
VTCKQNVTSWHFLYPRLIHLLPGAAYYAPSLAISAVAAAGEDGDRRADWRTNPATQIEWGLRYIDLSYGTPCGAWSFKQANDWY